MDEAVRSAVLRIWETREAAAKRAALTGNGDTSKRAEVTSGLHMDGIARLVEDAFIDAGMPLYSVSHGRRLELPGYYRSEKKWDIVVVHEGNLVAAVELKNIGSSYGNNMNNRAEEAMGNATDLWEAAEKSLLGQIRPWLGFVFVMCDEPKSRTAVGVCEPHFSVDPAFKGASYQQRAILLCRRLCLKRLYDNAWFVTADPVSGVVTEPAGDLSWAAFTAAIRGRVAQVVAASNR